MPNQNNTTHNNFSSDQNVSDKHLSYFNQGGQTTSGQNQQAANQSNPISQPVSNQSQTFQSSNSTTLQSSNPPISSDPLHQPTKTYYPNQSEPVVSMGLQPSISQAPVIPAPQQPANPTSQPRPASQPTVQPQQNNQTPFTMPIQPRQQTPMPANTAVQSQPPAPQSSNASTLQHANTQQPLKQNYINPNNFQQFQQANPKSLDELRQVAANANQPIPEQRSDLVKDHYNPLEQQSRIIQIDTYEILRLCIYLIPGLPIFVLLLKYTNDKDVVWHSKQALLMQAIWVVVYIIMQAISAPLISGDGLSLSTIWNILSIGILVYAGSQAYIGKRYRIPVVSEIGTNFIDKE
jgi:uncharacterized membrane protein